MAVLRLYTKNGDFIGYIKDFFNDIITREINAIPSFEFTIAQDNPIVDMLREEAVIEYQSERYLVKKIIDGRDKDGQLIKQVIADGLLIVLMYDTISSFQLINRTAGDALTEALRGNRAGWAVGTVEIDAIRSMEKEEYVNRYYLISKLIELYGGEIEADTKNRILNWRQRIGVDTGVRIAYGHNADAIRRIGDAYEFGTRLYALGYDNLTTAGVNGTGQPYIDADTISQYGVVDFIWKTQIRDAQTLYELALLKLELIKHPRRSYEVDVSILQQPIRLGDIVRVKDGDQWIQTRVVKMEEHLSEPWRNRVTLDTVPVGYRSLQERLAALMQTIDSNMDVWDKARLLDSGTVIEYGKRDYEESTVFQLSQAYYSRPVVWLGLQKENPEVPDPDIAITLIADFETDLDENNNILYTGVIAKVVAGPDSLPGFKITMHAYCRDPVTG